MSHKWKKAKRIEAKDNPKELRFVSEGTVAITASQGEGHLPTFEGNAYTGAPMRPDGWWDMVVIDLAGVKVPMQHRPVLRQHDHEQLVGHSTHVKVTKDGIEVQGVFSGQQEHSDKVVIPARNGFKWQMSLGANAIRKEYLESGKKAVVNGRQVTGPMVISRETEIGEISFVPLGADGKTSATVAATKGNIMNPFQASLKELMAELKAAGKSCTYSDDEIDNMDQKGAKAALKKAMRAAEEEKDDPDEDDEEEEKKQDKAKAKAKAAPALDLQAQADDVMANLRLNAAKEHVRQSAITAACREHNVVECELDIKGTKTKVNLAAHAIGQNWSAEQTELAAIKAARPVTAGIPGGFGYSTSTPQATEAVYEAAMLQAARHQFRLEDDSFYSDTLPNGHVTRRVSERMQREAQGELKARYTDQVQQAAHTIFKGRFSPHQLFKAAFRDQHDLDLRSEGGWRSVLAAWGHQENIKATGASNLSITNILANVLNKFALQGYLFTEQAWREIAGIRPVNDFKPTKSINLLGDVIYKNLGSTGQLQDASLGDQAFANQASPYGRILTIPWTHLVNDDLGMLTGAPMKIGQGAGLALNDYFWSLWAAMATASTVNGVPAPNGDDGNAFWRTTSSLTAAAKRAGTAYNKNTDTSAVLSTATLTSGKAIYDNQVDPNGNPLGFDGTRPVLLFGPSNWVTAMTLLQAEYIVAAGLASTSAFTSSPNKNIWQGAMKPVMSRYIENASYGNSTTAFWILFDPAALPVIEACFLNGVDTPAVLQAGPDYQFDKLGISIRGTMPFGVTQQNFRGGVFNAG